MKKVGGSYFYRLREAGGGSVACGSIFIVTTPDPGDVGEKKTQDLKQPKKRR